MFKTWNIPLYLDDAVHIFSKFFQRTVRICDYCKPLIKHPQSIKYFCLLNNLNLWFSLTECFRQMNTPEKWIENRWKHSISADLIQKRIQNLVNHPRCKFLCKSLMNMNSILDVWLGSKYVSEIMFHLNVWFQKQPFAKMQKYLCKKRYLILN